MSDLNSRIMHALTEGHQETQAVELVKVDAWLNDRNQQAPSLQEAVAQLSLCDPMEVSKRRELLAQRLGVDLPTLKSSIAKARKQLQKTQTPTTPKGKEAIWFNPGDVVAACRQTEALLHGIGLKFFERNRELVHTVFGRDAEKSKFYERDEDSVIIQPVQTSTLLTDLDELASFYKTGQFGPKLMHVPHILAEHLKTRVLTKPREVPFPTLAMVTTAPVLLPSGRTHQGLFEEGVLLASGDFHRRYKPIPDLPTIAEAQKALALFDQIYSEFPFIDPEHPERKWRQTSSYSVVLSATLSLVARPYLRFGPVPLHTFHAHSPRSGKSKLAKCATAAAKGHLPTLVAFTDEVEFGKHLLPLMRGGDVAILIDNVEKTLQSAKLNVLVTENVMKDRILGISEDLMLRNVAVIFATGNNLSIGGDLTVRSLRCDIDAKMERPEERHFEFDPVRRALELHPQLVVAALTALKGFLVSGAKPLKKRELWGGFEQWDELVSGCLVWAGYADPYETKIRVTNDDPSRATNANLLELLHQKFKEKPFTLQELRRTPSDALDALLKDGHWDGWHAQWVLRRLEGQIIGNLRLVRLKDGRSRFQVEVVGSKGGDTGASSPREADEPTPSF